MHRPELSERKWLAIEPYTREHLSRGRDNRLCVNAVVYRLCMGIVWRDLPERFGTWNTVARRFRRLALAGAWQCIFQALQTPDYAWVLVDSITVKAHKAATGQKKYPDRRGLRP